MCLKNLDHTWHRYLLFSHLLQVLSSLPECLHHSCVYLPRRHEASSEGHLLSARWLSLCWSPGLTDSRDGLGYAAVTDSLATQQGFVSHSGYMSTKGCWVPDPHSWTLTGREATVWRVASRHGRRKWTVVTHAPLITLPPRVTHVSSAHT